MIGVNEPLLNGNEKAYLGECIDTGWISSEGPFVKRFEKQMAEFVGRKYGIAVSNGTAALELAVAAMDLKEGDEVIIPSFTIISCAAALVKRGVKPVLVDSSINTWNMDVSQIEAKITKKTRAVMAVHTYGLPLDMDPLLDIAKKYGLSVIEDAAQMHGQEYKGRKCGSFGKISIFSFYPNKHITTGEGGMVLCNDRKLCERCSSLRNLCFKPHKRFVHDEIGYNFRMTNLQAAVGVAQFERLSEFVDKKRWIGRTYSRLLKNVTTFDLPPARTDYAENIYWVFGILLKEDYPKTAEDVIAELKNHGIGARPFFCPMHQQPVFKNMGLYNGEKYPVADRLYEKGFYIPSGMAITKEQIEKVVKALRDILS